MGMYKTVSVDVDVDLDLFDTQDLIEALCYRLKGKDIEKVETSELESILSTKEETFEITSIVDQLKLEWIIKVFSHYNLEEIMRSLPYKH